MNVEAASTENILRLLSPATARAMVWRRWMHVIEMRRAGKEWWEIGKVIDRTASTAQRLHAKAVLELQRDAARCAQCGAKFTTVFSVRYVAHKKKAPDRIGGRYGFDHCVFRGACPAHGPSWSKAFAKGEVVYNPRTAYVRAGPRCRLPRAEALRTLRQGSAPRA